MRYQGSGIVIASVYDPGVGVQLSSGRWRDVKRWMWLTIPFTFVSSFRRPHQRGESMAAQQYGR